MRSLIFAALLLLSQAVAQASEVSRTHQVWVTQNIKWVKMPMEFHPKFHWGYATVLYFAPDGKFGMIDCVLNREGSSLVISRGDGFNIYVGEWSKQNGILNVNYRLVERTVPQVGEQLPRPIEKVVARLRKNKSKSSSVSQLIFRENRFVPATKLDLDEVRSLFTQYWSR